MISINNFFIKTPNLIANKPVILQLSVIWQNVEWYIRFWSFVEHYVKQYSSKSSHKCFTIKCVVNSCRKKCFELCIYLHNNDIVKNNKLIMWKLNYKFSDAITELLSTQTIFMLTSFLFVYISLIALILLLLIFTFFFFFKTINIYWFSGKQHFWR